MANNYYLSSAAVESINQNPESTLTNQFHFIEIP